MSQESKIRVIEAIALSLWEDYGYPTKFGSWESMVPKLGTDPETHPEAERRSVVAANRCLVAARAVYRGLRDVSLGDLQNGLISPPRVSSEEAAVDIFSPIHVWADGSGTTADSPAGAGIVILYHGPQKRRIGWGQPLGQGTNNYAELSAIRYGLEAITGADRLRPVVVHSDSMYAIGASSGKNKVNANADLVLLIRKLTTHFRALQFRHVPGHSGVEGNELADRLAGKAAKTQLRVELHEVKI